MYLKLNKEIGKGIQIMSRLAYVPYNETMAAIFAALGLTVETGDFGGQIGWAESVYQQARADAWNALILLDEFNYDDDPEDDWDEVAAILNGDYTVVYWSTEQGHMPT